MPWTSRERSSGDMMRLSHWERGVESRGCLSMRVSNCLPKAVPTHKSRPETDRQVIPPSTEHRLTRERLGLWTRRQLPDWSAHPPARWDSVQDARTSSACGSTYCT